MDFNLAYKDSISWADPEVGGEGVQTPWEITKIVFLAILGGILWKSQSYQASIPWRAVAFR